MPRFTEGDRVRVDIPNERDPDHDRYHGQHGTIIDVFEDDAAEETGHEQDAYLFEIEFQRGETMDFRGRDLRPPLD